MIDLDILVRDIEVNRVGRLVKYSKYDDRVTIYFEVGGYCSQIKELVEVLPQFQTKE